jgi:SAM-dependent methyltransferase
MRDYLRLDDFLDSLAGDLYAVEPVEPHLKITRRMIDLLHRENLIRAGDRVLDIGCGQGLAMEEFGRLGLRATGVTIGPDFEVCRQKGLEVLEMDQNFLQFDDGEFDLLWCRHVLEHSFAPFFTLTEYRRLAKPGGLAYVEVPAPDTSAHHESNPNHYSCLPRSAWRSLFGRAGFSIQSEVEHAFEAMCGPDAYWGFVLRRAD